MALAVVRPFRAAPMDALHVTSPFGPRASFRRPDGSMTEPSFHAGLDLRAAVGTRVVAVDAGVIESIERPAGVGLIVRLRLHREGQERVSYMHLADASVFRGDTVAAGDEIGHSGDGDGAVAPHLHLEVKPLGASSSVDPAPYVLGAGRAGAARLFAVVGGLAAVGAAAWLIASRFVR